MRGRMRKFGRPAGLEEDPLASRGEEEGERHPETTERGRYGSFPVEIVLVNDPELGHEGEGIPLGVADVYPDEADLVGE